MATLLDEYNQPSQALDWDSRESRKIEIPVIKADFKTLVTNIYPMTNKPRGKAIIINNVVNDAYIESQRFKYIFENLLFDVQLINNLNIETMVHILSEFAQDDQTPFDNSQAFILMVISHGAFDKVLGFDACQAIEFNNEIPYNDSKHISDIVDLFSDSNCPKLKNKPKLLFFTCCRDCKISFI